MAVATAVAGGISLLVPAAGAEHRATARAGAAVEPEPAAAIVFLGAPAGLSVISTSDAEIALSWPAVSGAVSYRVERSPNVLSPYAAVAERVVNNFPDAGVVRGNTYLYRVRAVDAAGALSPPSPVAMATAVTFADSTLVAGVTRVKAVHVNDLRLAVDGVRRAAGLPAAVWGEAVAAGVPIRAEHVRELRRELDEGLAALGLPTPAYEDATLHGAPNGTAIRKVHFEQLRARASFGSGVKGSGLPAYDFASERLDPSNRTGGGGVDPLSRNFNWSLPLISLPGRAGLDLGLDLSYNSLVWTKSGDYLLFDGDWGWPAPGFRLGFPVVQGKFYDAQAQKSAYLLVTPSGSRVSLRRTTTPTVYEAGDSSYLQLTENSDGSLTLVAPGGTRMRYWLLGGAYKCTEVKDRNGNLITASYNGYGNLETLTDTLGRVLTFGYHPDGYLKEITQTWHREVEVGNTTQTVTETHRWARFEYDDLAVRTNFPGLTVFGPTNGQTIHALKRVTLADNAYLTFDYTTWGQVNKVSSHAPDGGLLNYVSLNLPADESLPQMDCPRPTQRRDWAAYWNGDEDGSGATVEEAVTSYGLYDFAGGVAKATAPDGTLHKETYETSGWKRGLTIRADEYSADDHEHPKKWTLFAWTQDDENQPYQMNPRVREMWVEDPDNNRNTEHKGHRTEILYTSFGLPRDVKEYDADAATVLRRTHVEYVAGSVNADGAYTARRIIGLPAERSVYGKEGAQEKLFSKVSYEYDLANTGSVTYLSNAGVVPQHDATNFGAGFTTRGNLCRARRWDATDPGNQSKSVASEMGYNSLGSALFMSDALGRRTKISYADSDGGGRAAYPTKVTDPDDFFSTLEYNYDMGAVTRAVGPKGAAVKTFYDAAGRKLKVKSEANGAYNGWEYGASGLYVKQSTIVDTGKPKTFMMSVADGAGRARGMLRELPGSTGGYSAQRFSYDDMGRQVKIYNPTEVSVNTADLSVVSGWQPGGDDATSNGGAGWVYVEREYDWKGRVKREINADGTDQLMEYGGCGCAGGEVVTLKGELVPIPGSSSQGRRTQKVYHDVLGRQWKTEVLDWDGSTVYSTATTTYNALDQAVRVRRYVGAAPAPEPDAEGGTYQTTTMNYDGHGRLSNRRLPEYDAGQLTTFTYNDDDTLATVTDPRGATATYSYLGNNRGLVTGVTHSLSGGDTNNVTYGYDAAGNRTSMADNGGTTTYHYDALSRMDWEERRFTGFPGTHRLTYTYTLANALKTITYPGGARVGYEYDAAGALTDVTAANFTGVPGFASGMKYRAWGGLKEMTYGNGVMAQMSYDGRQRPTRYDVTGLRSYHGGPLVAYGSTYSYHPDGLLSYAGDIQHNIFDRSYEYDHAGRLKAAKSGSEARGGSATDGPYRQNYTYDVWGNLNGRDDMLWGHAQTDSAAYANNRRQGWGYDAAGRVTRSGEVGFAPWEHTFDAAGLQTRSRKESLWTQGGSFDYRVETIEQTYGGDGQAAKRVETRHREDKEGPKPDEVSTTYFLRSSVLGGAILAEYGTNVGLGYEKRHVYAGGVKVAEQSEQWDGATWWHRNPQTGSWAQAGSAAVAFRRETDPLGSEVGPEDPFAVSVRPLYTEIYGGELLFMEAGDALDPRGGCGTIDGMPASCSEIARRTANGSAVAEVTAAGRRPFQIRPLDIGLGHIPTGVWVTTVNTSTINTPVAPGANQTRVESSWMSFGGGFLQRTPGVPRVSDNMRAFQQAVTATQSILSGDNRCSAFFKGAGLEALTALASKVTDSSFTSSGTGNTATGISMSPDYSVPETDAPLPSGDRYGAIAPDSITIYTNGPFIRRVAQGAGTLPSIGRYSPGRLRSQVLQLLHEVGHLVVTEARVSLTRAGTRFYREAYLTPLLPKDGRAYPGVSEDNTDRILEECRTQIDAIQE
jgi:YD repeat-containing protein